MENKELTNGTTLQGGKYTIERVIGEGGFGITYYARHNVLGHCFAIKEFFIGGYSMRSELRKTVVLQGIDSDAYKKNTCKNLLRRRRRLLGLTTRILCA